jgi:dehydrogenase/reductase SDR family protein 12
MAGDRLEMNFAVNVAGVYAMTELLMPALNRGSPDSRVITVASGGMLTENLTEVLQVFLLLRHSNCEKLKLKT